MSALVVVNPAAAGGRGGREWRRLEPEARRVWPDLTIVRTEGPGHAEHLAREWRHRHPAGTLCAAGGDGTVHEVVNGLLLPPPEGPASLLAILPTGTGNDFARNTGLALDPVGALERAAAGVPRRVDVGLARFVEPGSGPRQRAFVNSLSVGVSARANRLAHRIRRRLPGRLCYLLGGAAALLTVRPERWRVTAGDEVVLDGQALNLTVANGATFGGGLPISPGSSTEDGMLELVTIGDLGFPRAVVAFGRLFLGTHLRLRGVSRRPVTGVRIEGDGDVEVEADGEMLVASRAVDVAVYPGALRLLG